MRDPTTSRCSLVVSSGGIGNTSDVLGDPIDIETVILTDTPDSHARTDTDLSDKGAPGDKDGPVITRAGRTVVRPQRYMDCTG